MLKRILFILLNSYNKIYNFAVLKRKNVSFFKNLCVNGRLAIYGNGKIVLGNEVRINSGVNENPIGGMTRCVFSTAKDATLTIGDNVGISNSAIICHNSINIENNVLIGGNVKIYDTDFHSLDCFLRGKGRNIDVPVCKPVSIKEYAFIGAHSIILKGVTIGKRAIIGAGSVVTKDVGDDELWAGNPAKFIRKL